MKPNEKKIDDAMTPEEVAQDMLDEANRPKRKPYNLKIEGSLVPGRAPKSLGGGKRPKK